MTANLLLLRKRFSHQILARSIRNPALNDL
jgi:hypothetical protein